VSYPAPTPALIAREGSAHVLLVAPHATAALEAKGFRVQVTTTSLSPDDSNVGKVMSQAPESGETASKGSTVGITVGTATATTTTSSTSTSTTTTSP
jgi:beta-lactam-binding protein with PASTA domain